MTLRMRLHDPQLHERIIDRCQGKGPDRTVHNRPHRIAQASGAAANGWDRPQLHGGEDYRVQRVPTSVAVAGGGP